MQLITKSKFARMIGVSPQMVDKIQHRITLNHGHGKKPKVDLHGADTINYLKEREKKNLKAGQNQEQENIPELPNTRTGNNPTGLTLPDSDPTKALKKEKLQEEVTKLKIYNEQKRGDLIEKKLVELLFGKIYQIDVDQIKPLGLDLSPKIIGIINEQNKRKTKEISELLGISSEDQQSTIESILNSGEKEIKTKIISACEDISGSILNNVQSEIDNFLEVIEADD